MKDKITKEVVDTIISVISTDDGVIDVPQGDEGAFRKLCYFDHPDEIIPMEISGDETEITFDVLVAEHVEQYGERIAPFLYGIVRSLVKGIAPYPYGTDSYAELDDKGSVTFAIFDNP